MIEINELQPLLVAATIIVLPLVTGLVEVIKRTFVKLDKRVIPLMSVLTGLSVGLIIIDLSLTGAVAGVIVGLASTGLWEFGKTTVSGR